jgi:transposase
MARACHSQFHDDHLVHSQDDALGAAVAMHAKAIGQRAAAVKVGVEAAGHYHHCWQRGCGPAGWEVLELSPARVSEQRRVLGRRRVKTDAIDLEAITELVLAGHGLPVTARTATVTELTGWAMHRNRRVQTRTAIKNHGCAGHPDRSFGGYGVRRPQPITPPFCPPRRANRTNLVTPSAASRRPGSLGGSPTALPRLRHRGA